MIELLFRSSRVKGGRRRYKLPPPPPGLSSVVATGR
jgi:hypothetical protein